MVKPDYHRKSLAGEKRQVNVPRHFARALVITVHGRALYLLLSSVPGISYYPAAFPRSRNPPNVLKSLTISFQQNIKSLSSPPACQAQRGSHPVSTNSPLRERSPHRRGCKLTAPTGWTTHRRQRLSLLAHLSNRPNIEQPIHYGRIAHRKKTVSLDSTSFDGRPLT